MKDAGAFANSICDALKQASAEAGENDFPEKFTNLVGSHFTEDEVTVFACFYAAVKSLVSYRLTSGKISSPEQAIENKKAICDVFKKAANAAGQNDFPDLFRAQIQEYL